MIHIKPSGADFYVTVTADNGETLMVSETFTQKHNAINNIKAVMTQFKSEGVVFIDETETSRIVKRIEPNGDIVTF